MSPRPSHWQIIVSTMCLNTIDLVPQGELNTYSCQCSLGQCFKRGAVVRGWARTPEPCITPPTSCLAAAPEAAAGACTTRGAKITRGWEPSRAVHTMAPSGTSGRSQVKPQTGAVRGLGQEGHH